MKNELAATPTGQLSARPTETEETIDTSLVLRSVGYRGTTDGRLALRRRSRRDPQRERQSNRHRDRHADPGCLRRGLDQARTDWRDRHQQVLLRRDRVDDLRRLRWWAPRHPRPRMPTSCRFCWQTGRRIRWTIKVGSVSTRQNAHPVPQPDGREPNSSPSNPCWRLPGARDSNVWANIRIARLPLCVLMTMEMCGLLSSVCSGCVGVLRAGASEWCIGIGTRRVSMPAAHDPREYVVSRAKVVTWAANRVVGRHGLPWQSSEQWPPASLWPDPPRLFRSFPVDPTSRCP